MGLAMIIPIRELASLLFEHYEKVEFIPETRYTFINPLVAKNYPDGFIEESEFRKEILKMKPIFIAHALNTKEVLLFDFDYKLTDFSDKTFQKIIDDLNTFLDVLSDIIEIESYKVVFSGRGIHLYVYTPHLKNIWKKRREIGIITNEYPHLIFYEIVYTLLKTELNNRGMRRLWRIIDTSTISLNKLIRTPYSINNNSYLPVTYINDYTKLSLDEIITVVREPRHFKIWFKNASIVRVDYTYKKITTRDNPVVIDEYELLRHLITNNYNIKKIVEV